MRINNNLMAMNTHRQLGTANTQSAKSIEKLSSGYRINRAGDDAAGLAISEKMRGQIRGLNQASSNAQDGISLIQTAEGALNETHAILQRMRELAVQAASDTNVTADRGEIQKELTQLTEEIDRIATTTEFNTMKLVNGDRAVTHAEKDVAIDKTYSVNAASGVSGDLKGIGEITVGKTDDFNWDNIDATADANTVTITKNADGTLGVDIVGADTETNELAVADTIEANADGSYSYNAHGISFEVSAKDAELMVDDDKLIIDIGEAQGKTDATGPIKTTNDWTTAPTDGTNPVTDIKFTNGIKVTGSDMLEGAKSLTVTITDAKNYVVTITDAADGTGTELSADEMNYEEASGKFTYNNHGVSFELDLGSATTGKVIIELEQGKVEGAVLEDKSLKFQVGANEDQSISLSIGDMGAKALKVDTIKVDSHDSAKAAITTVNEAIEKVSGERSKLGAIQNRLEHTIKNLDTSSENLQASESRIRDVDMAKEMMEQTKQNILAQASTAMLAQANQAPQAVLQLLR